MPAQSWETDNPKLFHPSFIELLVPAISRCAWATIVDPSPESPTVGARRRGLL
jgi:hypothetical protein